MSEQGFVGVRDAAAEVGVPLHEYISLLCREGLLLVIPGEQDSRCERDTHVEDCRCRLVPSPHPSVREL